MPVTADAYATDRGELLCPSCASERRAEIEAELKRVWGS